MATWCFLGQLLFIGILMVPAHAQAGRCRLLQKATPMNFTVTVTPAAYQANTTYQVEISDNRNLTNSTTVREYLLQALSPQNISSGEWKAVNRDNCSSTDTAILNATQKAAHWTSPDSNISSVQIRVYILFTDNSAKFKTVTLNKESKTTTAPQTTSPNSVSTAQSSSFFIAAIQLLLVLVTCKLLS
ncbi:uncharacterized protein LJ264_013095 [Porphyrio hochstetteri]